MKRIYHIQGMHCGGCRNHIEKALAGVNGVIKVSVNLEDATATIQTEKNIELQTFQKTLNELDSNYTIALPGQKLHKKVTKSKNSGVGVYHCPMHCQGEKNYDKPGGCPVCGMPLVLVEGNNSEEENAYQKLWQKFKIAVFFTVPIFVIAMSEMLQNNPLYNIFPQIYWHWSELFLSIPVVFYSTWSFFERAWVSLKTMHLNMFTLIGIGSGIAWLFSILGLLFPDIFPLEFKTAQGNVFVYFEATTVILTLVLLGELLQARAYKKTNSAIHSLLELMPNEATLVIDGKEININIDKIESGNILRVKPGDKIPVDGKITQGNSHIDESTITGEAIPVLKNQGDSVYSGTINQSGSFLMEAQKVGSQTLLSQIVDMVSKASLSKAPMQKLADKIAGYFVPVIVLIAIITFAAWAIFAEQSPYVYGFVNAISVLVIACPCALGLATPISVTVGVGRASRAGILIKNAEALEKMNKITTLVVDKTGTLTQGKPSVEQIVILENNNEDSILKKMVILSRHSEHPLAKALVNYRKTKNSEIVKVSDFKNIVGKGIVGNIEGEKITIGNKSLFEQLSIDITKRINSEVEAIQKQGKTVSYYAIDTKMVGYGVIFDPIKQTTKKAIQNLKNKGIELMMLTGDDENTAKFVAEQLKIQHYKSKCLPEDKFREITKLQKRQKIVAMAGDGINDSPALTQADIGIAMGTGAGVTIESADITLVKGDLQGIVQAKKISDKVVKNIRQNLAFAFLYNALGVPVAAGVLYPIFGILLSPMIAAIAMSFSSISVIGNALRIKNINL